MFTNIISAILLVILFVNYYYTIKSKIKEKAVEIIALAEKTLKNGSEKMNFAIKQLKRNVPWFIKFLFKDKKIESIVQKIFENMEEYSKSQDNVRGG